MEPASVGRRGRSARRGRAYVVVVVASLAALLIAPGAPAGAQGALIEGIVVGPGGLCLDVEGSWSAARPPPPGTPIVLAVCDGSDDQRWLCGFGDNHGDLSGVGGIRIAAHGNLPVVAQHPPLPASFDRPRGGPIELGASCLTAPSPPTPGTPLVLAPCDGSASQTFTHVR